ncbi:MAG: hemin receptor [Polaribacter sp.]|nr:hemin receptor [Polaribacter sp.]
MKKITLLALLCAITFPAVSQSLGYQDLALLFSKDTYSGTARFNAMSGAFGALGGDVSAVKINPAGAAVFKNSLSSSTLSSKSADITSVYYGNSNRTSNNYSNFSQAGAVFVFNTYANSNWTKFAFDFNYSIRNDFRGRFLASGNSNFASFNEFPLDIADPKTQYNNAEIQQYTNIYEGEISEYNFAFSGTYQNNLYIGVAANTFNLNFKQQSLLSEQNNDGAGTVLNADFFQVNQTIGTGFSLSAGFIYKATKKLRLGLSHHTPIWFSEIDEETNITNNDGFLGDTEIAITSNNTTYANTAGGYYPSQFYSYNLKTPSKTIASFAYIFGSNGLISIDYSLKNYTKMKFSDTGFTAENQFFQNELKNTYAVNIGSEWRFSALSIRGGYRYDQNPHIKAFKSDDIKGYSFGAGYKFGNTQLDFSYQNNSHTASYDFYPQYNQVNAADLTIDNQIITATVTINL